MVSSLNGEITSGENPNIYTWTSKEDQEHFFDQIEHAQLILMGRKTYEQAKDMMKHQAGRLRMVFTTNPDEFGKETIPGQLEFTSQTPEEAVARLSQKGYHEALLVGGSQTNAAFLTAGLIDELWLTVEPLIFPGGTPLFAENATQTNWELLSVEKLNGKGTLLLKYKILLSSRT